MEKRVTSKCIPLKFSIYMREYFLVDADQLFFLYSLEYICLSAESNPVNGPMHCEYQYYLKREWIITVNW